MINQFLVSYIDAFLSFTPSEINAHYDFPAVMYTETGDAVVFSEEEFTANSKSLLQKYRCMGVGKIDYELLNTSTVSGSLELVEVIWHFKRADGETIYSAQTNYLLKKFAGGHKIASVIMVNEATEWAKVEA